MNEKEEAPQVKPDAPAASKRSVTRSPFAPTIEPGDLPQQQIGGKAPLKPGATPIPATPEEPLLEKAAQKPITKETDSKAMTIAIWAVAILAFGVVGGVAILILMNM